MEANMRVRAWCCLAVALSFSSSGLSEELKIQERRPSSDLSEGPRTRDRNAFACVDEDSAGFFPKSGKKGVTSFTEKKFTLVFAKFLFIESGVGDVSIFSNLNIAKMRISGENDEIYQCERMDYFEGFTV